MIWMAGPQVTRAEGLRDIARILPFKPGLGGAVVLAAWFLMGGEARAGSSGAPARDPNSAREGSSEPDDICERRRPGHRSLVGILGRVARPCAPLRLSSMARMLGPGRQVTPDFLRSGVACRGSFRQCSGTGSLDGVLAFIQGMAPFL